MSSDDTRLLSASQAAEVYGVDDRAISRAVKHLRAACDYPPTGQYVNRLVEAINNIAAAHVDCLEGPCRTCDRIAESLALVMGTLHIRMDEQLEVLVDPLVIRTEGMVAIGRAAPPPGAHRAVRAEAGGGTKPAWWRFGGWRRRA